MNANFIRLKDKGIISPEVAIAKDQTDWNRVDSMSDEELTQNALDDPDNPPLDEKAKTWELPAGTILGLNFSPED